MDEITPSSARTQSSYLAHAPRQIPATRINLKVSDSVDDEVQTPALGPDYGGEELKLLDEDDESDRPTGPDKTDPWSNNYDSLEGTGLPVGEVLMIRQYLYLISHATGDENSCSAGHFETFQFLAEGVRDTTPATNFSRRR